MIVVVYQFGHGQQRCLELPLARCAPSGAATPCAGRLKQAAQAEMDALAAELERSRTETAQQRARAVAAEERERAPRGGKRLRRSGTCSLIWVHISTKNTSHQYGCTS